MIFSLPPIDVTARPSGFWTDERVEQLRRLCATTALCASLIADELGIPRGKNAVIGKCRRLGIDLPGNRQRVTANGQGGPRPPRRRRGPQEPRAASPSPAAPRQPPSPPVPPQEPPMVTAAQPIEAVEALFECPRGAGPAHAALTAYMCRWPFGDPTSDEFFFCCATKDLTQPYCSKHAALVYDHRSMVRKDRKIAAVPRWAA